MHESRGGLGLTLTITKEVKGRLLDVGPGVAAITAGKELEGVEEEDPVEDVMLVADAPVDPDDTLVVAAAAAAIDSPKKIFFWSIVDERLNKC